MIDLNNGYRVSLVASSSKGNSVIVDTPTRTFIIDIGISYKRISEALASMHIPQYKTTYILVSHTHQDHLKQSTYNMFMKYRNVELVTINDGYDIQAPDGVEVVIAPHGDTTSATFIIDEMIAYTTDVSTFYGGGVLYHSESARALEGLQLWLIEANWTIDRRVEVQQDVNNGIDRYGYPVLANMSRHLSFDEAKLLIEKYKPRAVKFLHPSERFANHYLLDDYESNYNETNK